MLNIILFFTALILVFVFCMVALRVGTLVGHNRIANSIRYGFLGLAIFFIKPISVLYGNITGAEIGVVHLNFVFMMIGVVIQLIFINVGLNIIFAKDDARKIFHKFLYPPLILTVLYLLWCLIYDQPYNTHYKSFDEILQNIATVPIIYRLLIFSIKIYYFCVVISSIVRLDKLFKERAQQLLSNPLCCVCWLRSVAIWLSVLSFVHILVTIYWSALTSTIYYTFAIITLLVWEHRLIIRKNYLDISLLNQNLGIKWNHRNYDWETENINDTFARVGVARDKVSGGDDKVMSDTLYKNDDKLFAMVDKCIREEKLYRDCEFSFYDIKRIFPEADFNTINSVLQRKGHTFQSYIREMRIYEAAQIIRNSNSVRQKEIYYKVGFAHYSSFSRAFTSVLGQSPREYKRCCSIQNAG